MKFKEALYRLRLRSFDMRTVEHTLITESTVFDLDGIRWSVAQLQEICNSAVDDMFAALVAADLPYEPTLTGLYQTITSGIIEKTTGIVKSDLDLSTTHAVVALQEKGAKTAIYSLRKIKEYFGSKWLSSSVSGETSPSEDKIFSLFNEAGVIKIKALPIPSEDVPIEIACILNSVPLFEKANADNELPFGILNNLYLLYGERELRRREYNAEEVNVLTVIIAQRIQELKYGISQSSK